jgi:hypothetical protein
MSSNISVASTTPTASGLPVKKITASDVEPKTPTPKTAEPHPTALESKAPAEKPVAKPVVSVYTYEQANKDFETAKKLKPDAFKQYALAGSDLKAETVPTKEGHLTRFETGTIVKESKSGGPVTVSSPNGLVIESAILNKADVEQQLAEIDKKVDALGSESSSSEIKEITEKQLTHDLAESEIWGITMSDPDSVTINEKTEDIDVETPSGVFHLDKNDNIRFDRVDEKAQVPLTPSFKPEKPAVAEQPEAKEAIEVTSEAVEQEPSEPKKLSLMA